MRSVSSCITCTGLSERPSRRIFLGLIVWAMGTMSASAQQPLINQGLAHFYNLEYDQAVAAFSQAISENPILPGPHNHLARALIFGEMLRQGVLESAFVSFSDRFIRQAKFDSSP